MGCMAPKKAQDMHDLKRVRLARAGAVSAGRDNDLKVCVPGSCDTGPRGAFLRTNPI